MRQPWLLDLGCGPGGATRGYQEAGFRVLGVDLSPQPNYCGDEFERGDMLTFPLTGFDAVHASPPCQFYARVTRWRGKKEGHVDLLGPMRRRLSELSVPWVIENVPEAIPWPHLMLCGSMFGLSIKRHRHFLAPWLPAVAVQSCFLRCGDHAALLPFMHKGERAYADAMGCTWMNKTEARQAIPPAYTEWIGTQLMQYIEAAA